MRRQISILIVLVLLTSLATAAVNPDRCIGPLDNSTALGFGVPPISQSDIVWCDDFDTYCTENATAGSRWPGYPPDPDNVCTSCNGSDWFMKQSYHWQRFGVNTVFYAFGDCSGGNYPAWKGWDNNPGWLSDPFYMDKEGNNHRGTYATFDMTGAIGRTAEQGGHSPGATEINGSDDHPLILRFWMNDGTTLQTPDNWAQARYWPFYMELRYIGSGQIISDWITRAPTDYIATGQYSDGYPERCSANPDDHWALICQQINPLTGLQNKSYSLQYCPDLGPLGSIAVHSSLAFGWLANLDSDPCSNYTGETARPLMHHAATFDGRMWRELDTNASPAHDRFQYTAQQAFFEMTVKSTTYTLRLIAPHDCRAESACDAECTSYGYQICNSSKTLPRLYTGQFNRISMGAGPGCNFNPDGTCKTPTCDVGPYTCSGKVCQGGQRDGKGCNSNGDCSACTDTWHGVCSTDADCTYTTMPWGQGGATDIDLSNIYVDRPALLAGEGQTGSCCHVAGGESCDDGAFPSECLATYGNRFRPGKTCAEELCCPYPFADADKDGDVDQIDFAVFQLCYTGSGGGVPEGCECWDQDKDDNVAAADFTEFNYCWTGPNVMFSDVGLSLTNCHP